MKIKNFPAKSSLDFSNWYPCDIRYQSAFPLSPSTLPWENANIHLISQRLDNKCVWHITSSLSGRPGVSTHLHKPETNHKSQDFWTYNIKFCFFLFLRVLQLLFIWFSVALAGLVISLVERRLLATTHQEKSPLLSPTKETLHQEGI